MAQFSVYRNQNPGTVATVPFLLNIQNDLLENLATRVVIPLYRRENFSAPAKQLNPSIELDGQSLIIATQELAGVPVKILGPEVTSLVQNREQIIAALDLLITGF